MFLKDENQLRSLLAQKGFHKQVDAAKAIEVSANTMVRLFKGLKVHATTARRLAALVGAEVSDLFGEIDPKAFTPAALMMA